MIGWRCSHHLKSLLGSVQDYSLTSVGGTFLRRGLRGSRYKDDLSRAEQVITSPSSLEHEVNSQDPQLQPKVNIRKILKRSASFEETPTTEIIGDPFLSGPYTQGTRVPEEIRTENKSDEEPEEVIQKIDPRSTTVITFPGEGTQYVGMCGDHKKFPKHISILYEIASSILEFDLLDLCVNGPQQKLSEMRYAQPAVMVASLAALERLRDSDPLAVENCISTAGFGVGEISALVFSGCLTFENAVRLVKIRSEAMQLAGEMAPGGLSLVLYGADSKLGDAMNYGKEWCRREYRIEAPICSIANYLFPHCKIIGGNTQALDFIELNYKDFKLRKVKRLPAKAAYNTELMRPVAEPLRAFLSKLQIDNPRVQVYSCHTGYRYYAAKQIRMHLAKQVYTGLRWEQIIQAIFQRAKDAEFPVSYDCGPGNSLGPILKMVNRKAHETHRSVVL